MKKGESLSTIIFSIILLTFICAQAAAAQSEFSSKIRELADKLTSSSSGDVLDVENEVVYINLGIEDSIFEGSVFEVVRQGDVIMANGKPFYKEKPVGRIQVTKVRKGMAIANTIAALTPVQKGDKVYQQNRISPQGRSSGKGAGRGLIDVSGIDMESVHRRLENGGFSPGPFDRKNMTSLTGAIKRFQKFANLNVTGELDEVTWSKLKILYDPQASASKKTVPTYDASAEDSGVMKVNKIALMEFSHGKYFNDFTKNVYESLSVYFIQKGFQVVERSQLNKILAEQKISHSGLIDLSTAQKLGKLLGSEVALLGTISDMGNNSVIRARLVDVEKGVSMTAAQVEIRKTPEIANMLAANRRVAVSDSRAVAKPEPLPSTEPKVVPNPSSGSKKSVSYDFSGYQQGDMVPEVGEMNMIVKTENGLGLTSASASTSLILEGFSLRDSLDFDMTLDLNGKFSHTIQFSDKNQDIISINFNYESGYDFDEENGTITFGDHTRRLGAGNWAEKARTNTVKTSISNGIARLYINSVFIGLQEVKAATINKITLSGIKRDQDFIYSASVKPLAN